MKIADSIANALRIAQKNTERNPSDAQKESGNYAKGKLAYKGMTIAIENPKGGERSGVGPNGKRWSVKMPAAYGYVLGTEGKDGDHVDVYVGPDHASEKVYVVDQVNAESGRFDEHKVLLSYPSKSAALADYAKAFSDGKAKDRIGAVTEMSVDQFKAWVKSGKTKQPLGDLRMKRADGGRVQEEARPYEPSTWREAITDKLKDLVQMIPGGDSRSGMSAAQGAGDVLSGLVAPIGVQHGAVNLREGVRSGNTDRAISGAQDIGLGIAPYGLAAMLPKMTARGALSEYKAGQAPQKDIWSKENMARGKDRAYDAEKTGNKSIDNQASKINEKRKTERRQPVTADEMNYAVDQLPAWQRLAVRYGGMGNGRSAWLQPGHLALQGGNVALQDYLFDGGFMPWSWNAPGTVHNEARKIFAEPIKERPAYQRQHDPLKYWSPDPITRHVADVWNEAALPSQVGLGAMAAGVASLPFRRLRPLGAALGLGGAGAMIFNPKDPSGLSKSHDAWLEFERGSNAIQRDPENYADGGAVSPADCMLSGYADGGAPGDVLESMPTRLPEREMRRILRERAYRTDPTGFSEEDAARLAAHELWQRDVGEPGAINAIGELSGVNAVGRGSGNVVQGVREGDMKRVAAGFGEAGLGLLPYGAAAIPARAFMPAFGALAAASLPHQVSEAQAGTADRRADYISKDPSVANLRNELSGQRAMKPGSSPEVDALEGRLAQAEKDFADASAKNYKSTEARRIALAPLAEKQKALQAEIAAARTRASELFTTERAGRLDALEKKLADAEGTAGGEFMRNAPFRDRYPGAAEQIMGVGAGLAGAVPLVGALRRNLADKFVHQPSIMAQSKKVEQQLTGGTITPSIIGRMLGKTPETVVASTAGFNRERDVLDRMIAAREAREPSKLRDAATGAGFMMESRMIPEEVDAIAFDPEHPTRVAAQKALTDPSYYAAGVIPSALAGLAAAGTRTLADVVTKGDRPGMARAEAVRDWDWASKGPPSRIPTSEARGAIPALEARTGPQALDVDPLQAALSVARDRRLIDPPAGKGSGVRGEGPSPSSATGSSLSSPSEAPPKKTRKPSEPKEQGKGGRLPTNKEVKAVEEELRGMTAIPDASSGRPASAWIPAEPPMAALPAPEPTVIVKTPRKEGGWYSRNENGRFRGGSVKAKAAPFEKGLHTARQYATGGAVLAGPVVGHTGGREDALPVDVPHGCYVLPADFVSAIGENNSAAGMAKLEKVFGGAQSPSRRASGGAVGIQISDGEYVVPPEQIAKLGGGDMGRGHQVLDRLVKQVRDQHIKTLKSLPPPAKG